MFVGAFVCGGVAVGFGVGPGEVAVGVSVVVGVGVGIGVGVGVEYCAVYVPLEVGFMLVLVSSVFHLLNVLP